MNSSRRTNLENVLNSWYDLLETNNEIIAEKKGQLEVEQNQIRAKLLQIDIEMLQIQNTTIVNVQIPDVMNQLEELDEQEKNQ